MKIFLRTFLLLLLFGEGIYASLLQSEYKNISPKNKAQYFIDIDLDFDGRSYKGTEKIIFEYPFKKNRGLTLRLPANVGTTVEKNLYIRSVRVNGKESRFSYRNNTTVDVSGEFYLKQRYTIDIEFDAHLPEITDEDPDIFLLSLEQLLGLSNEKVIENNYGIFGCSTSVCNIASVAPSLAKIGGDDFLVLDTNGLGDYQRADFADYQISALSDSSVTIVSNGELKKSEELPDGKVRYLFFADSVNDIVIEASELFEYKRRVINGILYLSYYLPTADNRLADLSIDIASQAAEFYSRYYARYPYSELKIVSVPMTGGAGGVEFPALITVGDFLYNELRDVDFEGRFISKDLISQIFEFVIAHEVAHQWFSTLVPSDSREAPYMDEGLASFSAYLYFVDKYGEMEAKKFLENNIRLNYIMMRLLGYKDMPLKTPIEKYDNMFQYAGIIYGKAPLFFVRLREMLGKERFRFLFSNWVKERSFKDSDITHLISALKKNEPEKSSEIEALYRRWFENTFADTDIGTGSISDLLRFLNDGNDVDINIDMDKLKDWLQDTFDMFREYR